MEASNELRIVGVEAWSIEKHRGGYRLVNFQAGVAVDIPAELLRLAALAWFPRVGGLSVDRAEAVNATCVGAAMDDMGLESSKEPPLRLKDLSLAEMVDAVRVVREHEQRKLCDADGRRSMSVVCDDRLLAALYVATHYEPSKFTPVVRVDGRAVAVVAEE